MGWLDWISAGGTFGPRDVGWDVHNHLLPGVDDGVRDLAEAEQCVRALARLGYTGTVITPHIYPDVFDNDEAELREAFDGLAAALADRSPGFELQLGAEYYFDESLTDRLLHDADRLLRFGADRSLLLIELPVTTPPIGLEMFLAECGRQGIRPMIAHVERYSYGVGREGEQRLQQWREAGARLQVNVGSFAGQFGQRVRRHAMHLWQRRVIDLLGTDAHRPDDLLAVERGWRWLRSRGRHFGAAAHHALGPQRADSASRSS